MAFIIALGAIFASLAFSDGATYNSVTATYTLNKNLVFMGEEAAKGALPISRAVGKMYLEFLKGEQVNDDNVVIAWENTAGKAGGYQWLGFKDAKFGNKWLNIKFSVKFIAGVPAPSNNFGIKVFGVLHNEWVKTCKPDQWCHVSLNIKNNKSTGDSNYILLIFDTINRKQKVLISHLNVQIYDDNMMRIKEAIFNPSLRVMSHTTAVFPTKNAIGEMFLDEKDPSLITWKNTAGKAGGFQFIGWRNVIFANKFLTVTFNIKFIKTVPKRSAHFGVAFFGILQNDWVDTCKVDTWCNVKVSGTTGVSGDLHQVILIFDSVSQKQTVQIRDLKLEIH